MKTRSLVLASSFVLVNFLQAQVLCVKCFDQLGRVTPTVTDLATNGSFESSTCTPSQGLIGAPYSFCPNSGGYACDLDGWTCTGGGSSTYACLYSTTWSIIPDGTKGIYFGNYYANACSAVTGDTSCLTMNECTVETIPDGYPNNPDIAGFGGPIGVSLEQSIGGLVTGQVYVLEFWAGGEDIGTAQGVFGVDVGYGKLYLRCRPTPEASAATGTRYVIQFVASSTSQTIRFTNWGHICSDCTELVLDDVRVFPVGELSASVPACTTGLNDQATDPAFTVTQDPSVGSCSIRATANRPAEFIVYDMAARPVLRSAFAENVAIPVGQLPAGLYTYSITDQNGVATMGKLVLAVSR